MDGCKEMECQGKYFNLREVKWLMQGYHKARSFFMFSVLSTDRLAGRLEERRYTQ
jgi:hypothetical protein